MWCMIFCTWVIQRSFIYCSYIWFHCIWVRFWKLIKWAVSSSTQASQTLSQLSVVNSFEEIKSRIKITNWYYLPWRGDRLQEAQILTRHFVFPFEHSSLSTYIRRWDAGMPLMMVSIRTIIVKVIKSAVQSAAWGSWGSPSLWQGPRMVQHRNLSPVPVHPDSSGGSLQSPGDTNAHCFKENQSPQEDFKRFQHRHHLVDLTVDKVWLTSNRACPFSLYRRGLRKPRTGNPFRSRWSLMSYSMPPTTGVDAWKEWKRRSDSVEPY